MVMGPCSNRYLSTSRCTLRDPPAWELPVSLLIFVTASLEIIACISTALCPSTYQKLPIHQTHRAVNWGDGLFLIHLDRRGHSSVLGLEYLSIHLSEATQNLTVRQYRARCYFAQNCRLHYQVQSRPERDRGFRIAH